MSSDHSIVVRPVTANIGAEIRGVDLREPLDDTTYGALRGALEAHQVLFFREQDISPAQHLAW